MVVVLVLVIGAAAGVLRNRSGKNKSVAGKRKRRRISMMRKGKHGAAEGTDNAQKEAQKDRLKQRAGRHWQKRCKMQNHSVRSGTSKSSVDMSALEAN